MPGSPLLYSVFLAGILLEDVAPTGVEDDDVALAQRHVVHLEAGLHVGRRDHRSLVEARRRQAALLLSLLRLLDRP